MAIINAYSRHEFLGGRDKAIEDLLDVQIQIAPLNEKFHFIDISDKVVKNFPDFKIHQRELSGDSRKLMEQFDYITKVGTSNYQLTEKGKNAQRVGGHYSYIKQINEQEGRKREHEDAAHETNLSTTALNKYSLQTRYISLISLFISIVAIVYVIMEYYS